MKIFEKKIQDKSILNKRKPQESGFVMLTVVVIFLFISLGAALSIAAVVYRQHQIVNNGVRSAQSLYASESLQDDIFYRFTTGKDVSPNETLELNGAVANATIEDISDGKRSTSIGDAENRIRKTEMVVNEGSGASFFYGVQSGRGGFTLQNNAEVIGNIYSNGTVEGAGNNVEGDVVSATDSGLISGITTNYSAYAHRIEDSDIGQDAYYQSIFNTSVGGNEYPGSDDLPEIDLPISDEQIEDWEEGAESGGVISSPCPYQVGDSEVLGPVKITCDVEVSGNDVWLEGPVWVEGNIEFTGNSAINIDPSLGEKSVAIIADKQSDRESSSRIQISNNLEFNGSGEDSSYILLISQNNSAENGGGTDAIKLQNNAEGDLLLYAGHGSITIDNNTDLTEVTAYRIHIQNNATVRYESGLADLVFSTGPSGGYSLKSLEEIQ